MKQAGLTIIGLIVILHITGQSYFPIVEENKEWNVMYVIYPGTGWDTVYWTITYKFEGDTIISDTNYLKVYKSEEEIPQSWTFEGCIREDLDKKVFLRKWDIEYLKYDFGVDVGDTILIYENNLPVIVESIDSIEINNNIHATILLKYLGGNPNNPDYELWVEGIGSMRGILESGTAGYIGGWRWFICMSQNGELIYMNPNYNSCYLVSTGIDEKRNSTFINIYPNPTSDKIKIKTSENIKIESILIIDFSGEKIKDFEKNKTELDITGISAGIYLLQVIHNKGELVRKIIIR